MGKDSPSPPPAPDYAGAAAVTAQGNQDAARVAAKANRVSQFTPYGNLVYTNNIDGDQDKWRADVTLPPAQQQLLDSQNRMSLGLANVGETGVGYVADKLNDPYDWSKITANPVTGGEGWTNAYNSIMERSQPTWDRDQARLENQLANQGIARGTEAYTNAMHDFDQKQNDFRLGAQNQAMNQMSQQYTLDAANRARQIQEQSFARNEPLNMLNAVRSGAQVTNPTFTNTPTQATTQGPDMLGATQAGYNAQLAQYNAGQASQGNMMNGLFGLGSAAINSGLFF